MGKHGWSESSHRKNLQGKPSKSDGIVSGGRRKDGHPRLRSDISELGTGSIRLRLLSARALALLRVGWNLDLYLYAAR